MSIAPSALAKAGVLPIAKLVKREQPGRPLARRKPLRARRSRRPASEAGWHEEILGSVCVACEERPAVEGHHIIRVQVLRREAETRGFVLADVIWDRRNRLPLCRECHAEHHSGKRRLSHDLLYRVARWVYDFAEGLDLEWVLERDYVAPVFARARRAEEAAA